MALPGGGGRTARELAEMYGHSLVVEVLDEYCEQVGWRLSWEVQRRLCLKGQQQYGHSLVVEVLNEYREQVSCRSWGCFVAVRTRPPPWCKGAARGRAPPARAGIMYAP